MTGATHKVSSEVRGVCDGERLAGRCACELEVASQTQAGLKQTSCHIKMQE